MVDPCCQSMMTSLPVLWQSVECALLETSVFSCPFFPWMFVPKSHPERLEWYQVYVAETDFAEILLASQVLYVVPCLFSVCLLLPVCWPYTVCDCFCDTCVSSTVLFLNNWQVWSNPGEFWPPGKVADAILMVISCNSSINRKRAGLQRQRDLCFSPLSVFVLLSYNCQ